MKVTVIDDVATLRDTWREAKIWSLNNLVKADVGVTAGAAPELDHIETILPTLQRMNYLLYATIDGGAGVLYVNYRGFKFGRGTDAAALQRSTQAAKQAEEVVKNYTAQLEKHNKDIALYRERMGKLREGAIDLAEVKAKVMEWPEVLDFLAGPALDPLSGTYIDAGTFVVTLMPVIFPGEERGFGADTWMPSTPLRFVVSEGGNVSTIGADDNFTACAHPHMRGNGMCHGNLLQAMQACFDMNNIMAAVDMLREWRIANAGHDMEGNWSSRSFKWWEWWLNPERKAQAAKRELFLFNGKWDGKTLQLSSNKREFYTLEEWFGAPIDKVMHVMGRVAGNYMHYPSKALVKQYAEFNPEVAGKCMYCKGDVKGCPCHGATCGKCGYPERQCTCPLALDEPTVINFAVNNVMYRSVTFDPAERRYQWANGRRCEAAYGCLEPIKWRRQAINRPHLLCHNHLNKTATEAYAAALKKATEEFNQR